MLFSFFLVILWIPKPKFAFWTDWSSILKLMLFFYFLYIYISLYISVFFKIKHATYTSCATSHSCYPAYWFLCIHCSGRLPIPLSNWLLLSFCSSRGAYSYSVSFVASLFSILCFPTLVYTTYLLPLSSHHLLTFLWDVL